MDCASLQVKFVMVKVIVPKVKMNVAARMLAAWLTSSGATMVDAFHRALCATVSVTALVERMNRTVVFVQ